MRKTLTKTLLEIEKLKRKIGKGQIALANLRKKKMEKKKILFKISKEILEMKRRRKEIKRQILKARKEITKISREKKVVSLKLRRKKKREPKKLGEKREWKRRIGELKEKKRELARKKLEEENRKMRMRRELRKINRRLDKVVEPKLNKSNKNLKKIDALIKKKKEELAILEKKIILKEEERKALEKERQKKFQKALEYYKNKELFSANNLLEEILSERVEKVEKKGRPEFWERLIRVFKGPSLEEKAEKLLARVKKEIRQETRRVRKRRKVRGLTTIKRKKEAERKLREAYEKKLKAQEERFRQQRKELEKLRAQLNRREEKMEERLRQLMVKKMETEEEKRIREKELEKMKKKLEEEEKRLKEENRKMLKSYLEELDRMRAEKPVLLKEEPSNETKIYPKRLEIITKPEITKRREKAIEEERERLREEEKEVEKKEKEIESSKLTEEEKRAKKERIKIIRERIKEEVEGLEREDARTIRDKEEIRRQKKEIWEDLFNQAFTYYREKNLSKARELALLIKEEIEEAKNQGVFKDLSQIAIYDRVKSWLTTLDKEMEKEGKNKAALVRKSVEKEERKVPKSRKISSVLGPKVFNSIQKFLIFHHPIVGLDISDYSCELVRLSRQGKILDSGRIIFKPGIIVKGRVKNQKAFTQALTSFIKQLGLPSFNPRRGPSLSAVVSLPESQTFLQTFKLKGKDEIYSRVKELAEETLPISLEKNYWDFVESYDEKSGQTRIVFVAAPKEIIDESLIYPLRANGIEPIALEPEAVSVARALLSETSLDGGSTMILDIGAQVTSSNIFNAKGFIELSTTISIASAHIFKRIVESLNISQEKVEKEIENKGFLETKDPAFRILREETEKIIEEVKKAINYYQEESGKEVKRIILIGGFSLLPGIVNFFQNHFKQIKIEIPDIKKIKGNIKSLKEPVLYIDALGLALRGISKDPIREGINLLPKEVQRKSREFLLKNQKKKFLFLKLGLLITILIILVLVFYIVFLL